MAVGLVPEGLGELAHQRDDLFLLDGTGTGGLDRLYPDKLAHFSPLGRVVADFIGDRFFQYVAMHVKHHFLPYQG
jgi:hypothetical protein